MGNRKDHKEEKNKGVQYFVKWMGYSDRLNSWVNEADKQNC